MGREVGRCGECVEGGHEGGGVGEEVGRGAMGKERLGGGNGEWEEGNEEGEMGRATGRRRQGGGDGEWETGSGMTGRGQWGGGDGEGGNGVREMGRGATGWVRWGEG